MAYQSKYTGLQIDDILDSVEWKQSKIEDLASIRAGAQKGATALQSYTEKYTGTVTGIKINGVVKSGSGVIDLGTISTDISGKVDKVDGKQLSTEDFTTALKTKLEGIEANAQKNVQSDWGESDMDSDTYVNNRTHYSYDMEQVTSFSIASKNDGDILVTGLLNGVFYRIYNNAGGKSEVFYFVEGRKVVIPSNGPIIEAVCAYEDDYCLKLTTATYGMTESFILNEIYVEQLDDIYIPETIARKAEIATINGQSLTEGGDITIEGGAKVYEWFYDGESESVTLSQEEYDNITDADIVVVDAGRALSFVVGKTGKEFSEAVGYYGLAALIGFQGSRLFFNMSINISTKVATITMEQQEIPTKTSQLENDSNFITSEDVAAVALSGSYNDLQDTPTIPTKTSELANDNGLVDEQTLSTALEDYVLKDDGYAVAEGLRDSDDTIFYLPSTAPADTDRMLLTNSSLKTINGESIVGSGDITIQGGGAAVDNVYITDFTVNGLERLIADPNLNIPADIPRMYDAMSAHKVVLVPYDSNEGFQGYGVASGYKEDLLYVTITLDNGRYIDLEVSHDATDILGQQVRQRVWDDKQDALVSGTNIKTINGESIVGSGNIEISGGSGGSGAYSEVSHGTSDTTFTLTPNVFHVWDEVASLTLTLGDETAGVANEFLFQFNSGETATTLTLPDDIKWTEELTIEPNKIYQVSVLKGLASVLSWKVEVSIAFPVTLEMGDNGAIGVALYSYLQNTYGEPTSGTTLNEEIINNYNGVTFETIEYATYAGFTGYWLNGYASYKMSWVLLEDGYLQRVLPVQEI